MHRTDCVCSRQWTQREEEKKPGDKRKRGGEGEQRESLANNKQIIFVHSQTSCFDVYFKKGYVNEVDEFLRKQTQRQAFERSASTSSLLSAEKLKELKDAFDDIAHR